MVETKAWNAIRDAVVATLYVQDTRVVAISHMLNDSVEPTLDMLKDIEVDQKLPYPSKGQT